MSRFARCALAALVIVGTIGTADAAKRRAGSAPAGADETSLIGLHDLRREGGKLCMSEHKHYASSGPQQTRKAAEVAAMQQWASFTGWEYGSAWGNPALAGSRGMKCSGTPGSYQCDFEARPCRR